MAKKITIIKKATAAGKELEVGTTLSVSDSIANRLLNGGFAELFVDSQKKAKAKSKSSSEKKED